MSIFHILSLSLCVLGLSAGQVMFKKAALQMGGNVSIVALAGNMWLLAAFVWYALTTLLWVWVLRSVPLRLAFPFTGLAFFLVPCLSWLFLGEPLRMQSFLGGAIILMGIAVSVSGAS